MHSGGDGDDSRSRATRGKEAYAAVVRAHAAVFELGAGRAYAVVKVDDRRDAEPRSGEERLRSTREKLNVV